MTWADHLRGALIAIALVAHGIYALPLPKAVPRAEMTKDWRQRQLGRWQQQLRSLGIEAEPAELEDVVVTGSARLAWVHRTLKTPFKPVFQLTNTNQSWALFAGATTRPERLVVEIMREGEARWEPVERRLDPCCNWREDQLRYRRVRGVWDSLQKAPRPAYRGLVRWIGRRAFEDFPDAVSVRIYLEQSISTYPWRPHDPKRDTRHMWTFEQDELQ